MCNFIKRNYIIFFVCFLSVFIVYGFSPNIRNSMSEYNGEIEHLTFNTLMAFPEKALDPQNINHTLYDETKITPNEFRNILKQAYENNYVLISIKDLFDFKNDNIIQKKLFLPTNKKPLLLSFDNVTYKSSYQNSGEIDKIIIDRNNQFATYTTKRSIKDRITHDNEFIPILEEFIKQNPDFSFNSARAIIFLTGENGVLGYETNEKNAGAKHEHKRVQEVINKLKHNGWEFGSNNYKYINEYEISDLEFTKETMLWQNEVAPLINKTYLYAYPYGNNTNNQIKQEILLSNGFKIFFENSEKTEIKVLDNYVSMSRKYVTGSTLRNNYNSFIHIFDAEKVYDHIYRTIPFCSITQ